MFFVISLHRRRDGRQRARLPVHARHLPHLDDAATWRRPAQRLADAAAGGPRERRRARAVRGTRVVVVVTAACRLFVVCARRLMHSEQEIVIL